MLKNVGRFVIFQVLFEKNISHGSKKVTCFWMKQCDQKFCEKTVNKKYEQQFLRNYFHLLRILPEIWFEL